MKSETRIKRNERIKELAEQGYTLQNIGDIFGIKKNTVWVILNKQNNIRPLDVRRERKKHETDIIYKKRTGLSRKESKIYSKAELKIASKRLTATKSRAKRKCIECTIRLKDVLEIIVPRCPVFGAVLTDRGDMARSIDRIDNTKGYIPGNIQMLSWRANKLKSNGTLEEFIQLVNFLKK